GHHPGFQKNKVIARSRLGESERIVSTCVFFHQRHFNYKNLKFTGPNPTPLQRGSAQSQQCPPGNGSVPAGNVVLDDRLSSTGDGRNRMLSAHSTFCKEGRSLFRTPPNARLLDTRQLFPLVERRRR